jgi:hypothetical protein
MQGKIASIFPGKRGVDPESENESGKRNKEAADSSFDDIDFIVFFWNHGPALGEIKQTRRLEVKFFKQ